MPIKKSTKKLVNSGKAGCCTSMDEHELDEEWNSRGKSHHSVSHNICDTFTSCVTNFT